MINKNRLARCIKNCRVWMKCKRQVPVLEKNSFVNIIADKKFQEQTAKDGNQPNGHHIIVEKKLKKELS